MAEVTGNLGSESIRLRGMALEATQESILKELEDMSATMTAMGKAQGVGSDGLSVASRKLKKSMEEGNAAEEERLKHLEDSNKGLGGLAKVFKAAGAVIGGVASSMAENIRMTRGFDSNINNASYALQHMAANSKGVFREFYKMGASTVDQLQEQYDVYKRLSNIGGVAGAEFSKMRENAATMGLTMQAFAGLMEENFLNLRLGGLSARASMKNLGIATAQMRDGGAGLNNEFLSLGIEAQDYGHMILQNSMLMGGLSKAQKDSTSYTGGFNQKMLDTTKSITALSEAFGFNREQTMKAANDALKNGRNRAMYDNIKDAGKEQMLTLMTGLFGGDAQKGLEATIAAYTGRFTQFTGTLASVAPDFLGNMKNLAAELNKNPKDLKGALERSGLGPMFTRLSKQQKDLVESTWMQSGAIGDVVDAIVNANAMFNDTDTALKRMQERLNGGTDKQLTAYGDITRENIKMAIIAAKTNSALNDFGIGLAIMSQLMALSMSTVLGAGIKGLANNPEIQDLLKKLNELQQKGISAVGGFNADAIATEVIKKVQEATTGKTSTDTKVTDARPARVHGGNKEIKVQGRSTTVDDMFNLGAEATAGGTTALAVKQLLGLLAETDPGLNVTATNDTRKNRDSTHATGRALDFQVQGLRDPKKFPEDSKKWAEKADEVRQLLKDKGLESGKDFTVIDEANYPIPGVTTGPHIHVNFTPEGMGIFEGKMKNNVQGNLGNGGAQPVLAQNYVRPSSLDQTSPNGSLDGGAVYSTADATNAGVNTVNVNGSITMVSLDQPSVDAIVKGLGSYYSNSATLISGAIQNAVLVTKRSTYPV